MPRNMAGKNQRDHNSQQLAGFGLWLKTIERQVKYKMVRFPLDHYFLQISTLRASYSVDGTGSRHGVT
jgi:hypothetical protein